ncbi:MAG: ATP-binding protein [Deltaproteobacteria bacterium]|nr:ATP-binding protein [Deltaproteobacteria bacterium]
MDDGEFDEPTQPTLTGGPSVAGEQDFDGDKARLVGVSGSVAARKFPVGNRVTVGRSSKADISVEDLKLSRIHFRIIRQGKGYVIEDLDSKNGTLVNQKPVTKVVLEFGNEIRVGDTVFLFTHHNPVEDKLLQKQRMELLGRIGAGVAHDFNNLLGAAIASVDFLTSLPARVTMGDSDVVSCLTDIDRALKRAAELSSRLLGVSRQHGYLLERLDLGNLCREVIELLRRTLPRSVEAVFNCEPSLEVMGDWGQLHQVVMNVCVNARDAMSAGGTMTVAVVRRRPTLGGDGHGQIVLTIEDTGKGMDEATRRRAFDPFFTTKGEGEGTGLGLATVLEIVKYHGGQVDLKTAKGQGTMVGISLPSAPVDDARRVSETAMDLPTIDGKIDPPKSARLVVLIVDDNGAVRRSLGRLLKAKGYDVLHAADGSEGLRVYGNERPDLVLMDLDMPVLAGPEAYRQLKALDPNARVIIMSGHSIARVEANHPWPDEGPVLLQKPCGKDDLEKAISAALARS